MSLNYDADGARVKTVIGGITTVQIGNHYEKNLNTGEVTKYYYFGGQRVAMRKGSTLNWLHSDHLCSVSLATNSSGGTVANSAQRYKPPERSRRTAKCAWRAVGNRLSSPSPGSMIS